jgi:hypothetical protein
MDAGLAGSREVAFQRRIKELAESAAAISSGLGRIEQVLSRRPEPGD